MPREPLNAFQATWIITKKPLGLIPEALIRSGCWRQKVRLCVRAKGCATKKLSSLLRISLRSDTACPVASAPCALKTANAISKPIVAACDMDASAVVFNAFILGHRRRQAASNPSYQIFARLLTTRSQTLFVCVASTYGDRSR